MELSGKDLAYWERNQLVLYLSKIFPSWLERHPIEDTEWEDVWRNIIFIQFPEGIFSWHFHDFESDYFKHLKFKEGNSWNGSTTEEKYQKLRAVVIDDHFINCSIMNENYQPVNKPVRITL